MMGSRKVTVSYSRASSSSVKSPRIVFLSSTLLRSVVWKLNLDERCSCDWQAISADKNVNVEHSLHMTTNDMSMYFIS